MRTSRRTLLVIVTTLALGSALRGSPSLHESGSSLGGHRATAASAVATPLFTNVTKEAGVDYVQFVIPDPPPALEPLYMSGGAAAGDYDGDGWVDLYVTRLGAPGILFRNKHDGTFEDVTVAAGLGGGPLTGNGAGWVDIDNDGDLDLYVTSLSDTRFYLYINDGAGHFTEEAVARGAAVAGVDQHFGYSVAFGDYDQDGWLDIHTTEWRPNPLNPSGALANARLLHNRGAAAPGHFEDVTAAAGVALDNISPNGSFSFASRFTDLDGDGWPDLIITSDFGTSRLFWNNRDGTFTDGTVAAGVGKDENGMGSALGDYDGDGRLDWFVTSIFDPAHTCATAPCQWGFTGNRLYRNMGNRTFSDQTDAAGVRNGFWGWGAAFFDFDNDGDLDLIMTNGVDFPGQALDAPFNADPMRLWRNEGAGSMTEISAAAGITDTGSGKGLLTFDYDHDGDLDVFVVNNAGHPVLYRNDTVTDSGWLRVRAMGRQNREAIGAGVTVRTMTGGPSQYREIDASSHFLGQSETTAHFGLGPGIDPVAEVKIRWPHSFTLQTLNNVSRNSTLVAQEPVPPVTLKVNGQHPDNRKVQTPPQFRLSLDMVPGPFTQPLDWYFGLAGGGVVIWVTSNGVSLIPAPLVSSVAPSPLTDATLFQTTAMPGNAGVVFFLLTNGTEVVALDFLDISVASPPAP
jgi:hypothetical protein